MFECDIVKFVRKQEKKEREVLDKKNRATIETYTNIETFDDFYARVKNSLNDNYLSKGWEIINTTYTLPLQGERFYDAGWSVNDFDSAEFLFVLQREK